MQRENIHPHTDSCSCWAVVPATLLNLFKMKLQNQSETDTKLLPASSVNSSGIPWASHVKKAHISKQHWRWREHVFFWSHKPLRPAISPHKLWSFSSLICIQEPGFSNWRTSLIDFTFFLCAQTVWLALRYVAACTDFLCSSFCPFPHTQAVSVRLWNICSLISTLFLNTVYNHAGKIPQPVEYWV